ncbi:MAG: tetratricopeptide repeat protein [Planctomycetes bacterium]|nr:tetratricopeptide repeat protein [Planctomycetota bacterium]
MNKTTTMSVMATVILVLGACIPTAWAWQTADETPTGLEAVRAGLRWAEYGQAVAEANRYLRAGGDDAAEVAYLKALALYRHEKVAECEQAARSFVERYPDSDWYRKGRYLLARALSDQRKFEEAEGIYQEEADRLLSSDRKKEIAQILIQFADELSAEPGPNDLDAPPPDYRKAISLYSQVLEMEIPRPTRDMALYTVAGLLTKSGSAGEAVQKYREYLAEFDPTWTGPVGSVQRMRGQLKENPEAAGQWVVQARYELAGAQLKSGDSRSARMNLEALRSLIELMLHAKDARARAVQDAAGPEIDLPGYVTDCGWRVVQTYGLPETGGDAAELGIKAARDFLAVHPDHPRSVTLAWLIGESYRHRGQHDRAIEAYEQFMAGEGYRLPSGDAASVKLEGWDKTPAELEQEWQQKALFLVGQLRYAQRRYSDAINQWDRYVNRYPNGPDWAQAQRQIIDAKYMIALTAVAEKEYEAARGLFEGFMAAYPLDGRVPQAMFTFGQMSKALGDEAEEQEKGLGVDSYRTAIAEWGRLISKYPDRDESSLGLWRTGRLYETGLGELATAVECYRRLTWGPYAEAARQRLRTLTEQRMSVETERTFRADEPAVVSVDVRNIKELTIRQYRLDPEAYFRKTHLMGGVEALDIALIEPDEEWTVSVEGYEKYKEIEQAVEVPFEDGRPGVCLVNISGDDEFEATTLVIRSDLDLVIEQTLADMLVYVQDMRQTKPAADVHVLVSDGSEIFTEASTDADGIAHIAFDEARMIEGDARVFVERDGHIASGTIWCGTSLGGESNDSAVGYIYTDQPVYRPGQVVRARGIIRDVNEKGQRYTPAGKTYSVSVIDPASRQVQRQEVTLSEFGTFTFDMALAGAAPMGGYAVVVQPADKPARVSFHGRFEVQQYTVQKMKLAIDLERLVYRPGETITGTIRASYYWGGPVANQAISYTLPGGRQYVERTDEKGEISIEVETAGMGAGDMLPFIASIQGENVQDGVYVFLAEREFDLTVRASQDVALAGEPFDVTVQAATLIQGDPVGCDVTLRVLRTVETPIDPVVESLPWANWPRSNATEEVARYTGAVNAETGTGVIQVTLAEGGHYQLQVESEDRNGTPVSGAGACFVSGESDDIKLRLFAETDTLKVGEQVRVRLHSRVEGEALALITFIGDEVIAYRVVPLRAGDNAIPIEVGEALAPNFTLHVAVMSEQDLFTASHSFTVERELQVAVLPADDVLVPGEKGMVDLVVTDQAGNPVEAELSLSVVDEALLARYPELVGRIVDAFNEDQTRYAMVDVGASNGFAYQAVTQKVIKALVEEQERLARHAAEGQQMEEMRQELGDDIAAFRSQSRARFAEAPAAAQSVDFPWQGGQPPQMDMDRKAGAVRGGLASKSLFGSGGDGDSLMLYEQSLLPTNIVEYPEDWPELSAGYAGVAFGLSLGQPAARREFESGGWWASTIVTDADGKARVEVAWPERTTEWRVTARGADRGMLVGEGTSSAITRKDLFVEIKAPLSAVEGDTVQVLARVHNPSGYEGAAVARLAVTSGAGEDAKTLVQQEQRIEMAGEGEPVEVLFGGFSLPAVGARGSVQLTVSVVTDAADGPSDALTRWMLVEPWGMEYVATRGGTAEGDVSVGVQLPGKPKYDSVWMNIMVGPTLEQSILDLALRAWPVARFEGRGGLIPTHPSVELLASASGLAYAKKTGSNETDRMMLLERSRALAGSLVVQQEGDGGWAAISDTGSDWMTTAMSYWGLSLAQANGVQVAESVLISAEQWLRKKYQSMPASDFLVRPVVLHALSVRKKADFEWANSMYRQRNALDSLPLAYTALTMANLDRPELAKELMTVLEGKAKRERAADESGSIGWHCSWRSDVRQGLTNWYDQDTVVTAIALMAYTQISPGSDRADEAAAYLMDRAGLSGCRPVWGRGFVVAGLAAHYGVGEPSAADYQIAVTVNGKAVGTIDNRRGRDVDPLTIFEVPADMLRADRGNVVQLAYRGRGKYTYSVRLSGFSGEFHDSGAVSTIMPEFRNRRYLHAPLNYRGVPLSASSDSPVQNVEVGQRVQVRVDLRQRGYGGHLVIEEPLPAGLTLVPDSPSGNFASYEVRNGRLVLRYRPGSAVYGYSYELTGFGSGTYRVSPMVMRDAFRDDLYRVGKEASLTVLAPGEASTDEYHMSSQERLELGRAYFDDGLYREAESYLWPLFDREKKYSELEVARMLLWIHTTETIFDASRVVQAFEILSVRRPDLTIPFDRVLSVGRAYGAIGEHEMGWRVYRAAIESSFLTDSAIGAVLQDEGQLLGSVAYQLGLWQQYPDTSAVIGSHFALSQLLYESSEQAHQLKEPRSRLASNGMPVGDDDEGDADADADDALPTRAWMLGQTIRLLDEFLVCYSDEPLADDAAFSMSNAFLDLHDYQRVVSLSEAFGDRFEDSEFAGSFQYMAALGHFWQRAYEPALDAATAVADGESKDRGFARYIVGQIYHAKGKPADAITWYEKVEDQYSDAREAITYFERKALSVDEITTVKPGEDVTLKVQHRNVDGVHIQVYRVDLMKLYLREKSLSSITKVNLAGIEPTFVKEMSLADASAYADHDLSVALDIEEEGAYLVICRAENLYGSGLVLVTPLSIEVQEEVGSGRVRVNLIDDVSQERPAGVHVKAVGSMGDGEIRSGETDLRGVYVADGLVGEVTVIARDADARYAFYRGEQLVGAHAQQQRGRPTGGSGQMDAGRGVVDYTENLRFQNTIMQQSNRAEWDKARRSGQKGVDLKQLK